MTSAGDLEKIALEVYVLPFERQQLTYAQSRIQTDYYAVQFNVASGDDFALYFSLLAGSELLHFFLNYARSLYVICHILGGLSYCVGTLQGILHNSYD